MKTVFRYLIIFFLGFCLSGCDTQLPQKQVLKFSTWGSHSEMQIIKPLVAEFEEQNNVKVEIIHIPQNYFQKLHLLFASHQAPDVAFINNFYLPLYANAGLLEDLRPYFKQELNDSVYFKNALEALSINGTLYAIARDVSNLVVYYNKDIFKSKSIPFPDENWTFDNFTQIAQKLTDKEIFGTGFEENLIFWEPIIHSNGGRIFSKSGELELNKEASKTALKKYIDLRTELHAAPSRTQSANRTMAQMFLDKKIAMQISGRWLVPKFREEADFDWDIAPLPKGSSGAIFPTNASGWAISKSSENKQLSAKFIKYLSSRYAMSKITQSGLIIPARKDVAYSNEFLDGKKPQHAKFFIDANNNAQANTIPDDYNTKIERLIRVLEPYFNGNKKITPDTEFEL